MPRSAFARWLRLDKDHFNRREACRRASRGANGLRTAINPCVPTCCIAGSTRRVERRRHSPEFRGERRKSSPSGQSASAELCDKLEFRKIETLHEGAADQTGGRRRASKVSGRAGVVEQAARGTDARSGGLRTAPPGYSRHWRVHKTLVEESG